MADSKRDTQRKCVRLACVVMVMIASVSVSHAGSALTEDEMREATEAQSLSNVDELHQTQAEKFQREAEHSKDVSVITAIPAPLDMRQQDLLRGSLTPDNIRQENLNESYRQGTIEAPWAYF